MGKLTSITLCRLLRKPCGIGARLQMLVFAWLLACLSVSAQKHYMAHVHVGAHGGVSLSNVSFYPHIKEQLLPGMQMGVSFRYVEERHVGIMAEVNIEQRGWKENFEELNDRFDYLHRTTYVELPILTHIFFGSRVVKGFFNLGPELCYMIDGFRLPCRRQLYSETSGRIHNRYVRFLPDARSDSPAKQDCYFL